MQERMKDKVDERDESYLKGSNLIRKKHKDTMIWE